MIGINPVLDPDRKLDPADMALLAPLRKPNVPDGKPQVLPASEVSWMRNSSLFTRKTKTQKKEMVEAAKYVLQLLTWMISLCDRDETVDASEAAQLMAIDKTFSDVQDQNLDDIRHPDAKKQGLRVVEVCYRRC